MQCVGFGVQEEPALKHMSALSKKEEEGQKEPQAESQRAKGKRSTIFLIVTSHCPLSLPGPLWPHFQNEGVGRSPRPSAPTLYNPILS